MHTRWSWIARAISLAILLAASPLHARAGPNDMATPEGDELYLAVSLNQADTGQLARFVLRDGDLYASTATLRTLGLKWPGSDQPIALVALRDLPGLEISYDSARQRIALVAPTTMLDQVTVRAGFAQHTSPLVDSADLAAGAIFNYSAYGQRDSSGNASLSGVGDVRVFGIGPGVWSTSINSRVANGTNNNRTTRLDSAWQLDLPTRMVTLVIGDTVTGAAPWSRPLRIGGIRVARNFQLQPYRITAPLASFSGEAALPSTVDLFVNGLKQSSQSVPPGQFVFDSAPTLDGAGNAHMVITDINGQQRVVEFAFYGTPQLLARGLSDWSVELGTVRHGYAVNSFDYAPRPMASASGRFGWRASTTLEGHVEGDQRLQVAGVGVTQLLGTRGGLVGMSVAVSSNNALASGRRDHGVQRNITYQWATRGFSFNLTSTRNDDDFRDLASLEGAPLARATDQAYLGLSGMGGQWGLGAFRRIERDGSRNGFASLGWSLQTDQFGYFGVQLNRRIDSVGDNRHGIDANFTWSLALGRQNSVSLRAGQAPDGKVQATAEFSHQVPGEIGGWGWRAEAGSGGAIQAQTTLLGRRGQWTAGLQKARGGGTSFFASADGGVALLDGHAFAMRRVDQAFALVSTNKVADVPVRLANNVVGRTDANGLLLVTRLNPWQENRLSIDPLALPADMSVALTEKAVVPLGRTGVLVDFPMQTVVSLQVSVEDAHGQPLPAGSPVWLVSANPITDAPLTVIGQDSLLYLQDAPSHARLRVRHDGIFCELVLPEVVQTGGFAELEGVVCQ